MQVVLILVLTLTPTLTPEPGTVAVEESYSGEHLYTQLPGSYIHKFYYIHTSQIPGSKMHKFYYIHTS